MRQDTIYHGVIMALNLKNLEVERLAADVARLTGESKTRVEVASATNQRRAPGHEHLVGSGLELRVIERHSTRDEPDLGKETQP